MQIDKTTNEKQPHQKTTTRKSPSQTCVSPAETAKQTAKDKPKHKNGARAQTKNTHRIDLQSDAVAKPLHHTQNHAKNELCIAAAQADMKTLALKLTLA